MNLIKKHLLLTCLIAASFGLFGCGRDAAPPQVAKSDPAEHAAHKDGHDHGNEKGGHDHSGWWCGEHGIPEAECSFCDDSVRMALKKKGDWCKEHDRPDSQCFLCHPEKLDEYAAKYEAKFGKKPPKAEIVGIDSE